MGEVVAAGFRTIPAEAHTCDAVEDSAVVTVALALGSPRRALNNPRVGPGG